MIPYQPSIIKTDADKALFKEMDFEYEDSDIHCEEIEDSDGNIVDKCYSADIGYCFNLYLLSDKAIRVQMCDFSGDYFYTNYLYSDYSSFVEMMKEV